MVGAARPLIKTFVNANLIGRKTLTGPFRDLDWIAENLFETDIW